ncbi:hypothetical protein F7731_20745 [Cytobacillus depressus]|uniref:Uncharacterized protein n=1 Tax=Cytobacillus depressus TaxID=1602942 RepID=A0A6L3V2B6_9BACI|nr:hypothetical protein [Cytobacillus depressus]KAB2330211.1 hypothetical protein F7731_20745 [Cytobacillus depressus]
MTKNLIRLYWKMGKNQFRTAPDSTKIAIVFSSIAAIIFTVILSFAVGAMAMTLPSEFFSSIYAYAFSALLTFNILFGVPQVFKNLYGTNDLTLLFTLPIKTRSIYWFKFLQSFIGFPGFFCLFSIILLTVFGIASRASILFFPIAYLTAFLFTLIGMSIAYLLNLLLIQIIPVHRAKELMTAMSALAGIIVYVLTQLPNLLMKNQPSRARVADFPPMPKWIPMEWAAQVLSSASVGSIGFILPLLMTIILTLFMLSFSSSLVEKGFRTGWIKMNEGNRPKKKRKGTKVRVKLTSPVIAIGVKEWRAIQRDIREWVAFIPFVFFMFFPVISIMNDEESIRLIMNNPDVSWMVAQAIFLFIFTFLTSGFASSSIAREAYSIHLLHVLPLSGWKIALGKFWINWLIPAVFLFVLEIAGGIILKWHPFNILFGMAVVAIISLGITGIGLWLGSIGAKYNPNNPQNRLETGVSFLLMFLSFGYLLIAALPSIIVLIPTDTIAIFNEGERPMGLFGLLVSLLEWKAANQILLMIISAVMTIAISLGVALFTLKLSARKIDKGITINFVANKK